MTTAMEKFLSSIGTPECSMESLTGGLAELLFWVDNQSTNVGADRKRAVREITRALAHSCYDANIPIVRVLMSRLDEGTDKEFGDFIEADIHTFKVAWMSALAIVSGEKLERAKPPAPKTRVCVSFSPKREETDMVDYYDPFVGRRMETNKETYDKLMMDNPMKQLLQSAGTPDLSPESLTGRLATFMYDMKTAKRGSFAAMIDLAQSGFAEAIPRYSSEPTRTGNTLRLQAMLIKYGGSDGASFAKDINADPQTFKEAWVAAGQLMFGIFGTTH